MVQTVDALVNPWAALTRAVLPSHDCCTQEPPPWKGCWWMVRGTHGRKAFPGEVVAELRKLEGRQAAPLMLLVIRKGFWSCSPPLQDLKVSNKLADVSGSHFPVASGRIRTSLWSLNHRTDLLRGKQDTMEGRQGYGSASSDPTSVWFHTLYQRGSI